MESVPPFDHEEAIACARYDELDELKALVSTYAEAAKDVHAAPSLTVQLTARGFGGSTALHMASANGNLEVVKYLLGFLSPAAASLPNDSGNTPLHWAALNGHKDVVEALVRHGVDLKPQNETGRTPLSEAMHAGHEDAANVLIQHGAIDDEEEDEKLPAGATVTFEDDEPADEPAVQR